MQRDLSNNDNDWQLKKLQHDSLKTADKVVEVLREAVEKEVLALAKDYERLFGIKSAQFTEYLTMVAQKLELHGVLHEDVINFLNSAANEGSVPTDYASDLRDSQSKTVPFIPGGPMQDFGEQSLLDKSLGNMGVSSARPTGMGGQPFAPTASSDDYQSFDQNQNQPHNGNGHNSQPQQVTSQSQSQSQQFQQPQQPQQPQPFSQPQSQPAPQPAVGYPPQTFGGAPLPMQQPQSQPQTQQISAPQPSPFAQPAFPQPPFGQPSAQPGQGQPAAPANLAITTSQPAPVPGNSNGQNPGNGMGRREDDDKYVFDPFTAWD